MPQFDELLSQQIPSLRRYARALTQDVNLADDLVQDCLERAFSNFDRWQQGTNFRAWLFTIMHNAFINSIRRAKSAPSSYETFDSGVHTLRRDDQHESGMLIRDLGEALSTLPDDQKEVLLLVGLEGLAYKEVSEVLGIPVGTVMSRLHRAREFLRSQVYGVETAATGDFA